MIAHILPCVLEVELLALAAWLLEHASLVVTSARQWLRSRGGS